MSWLGYHVARGFRDLVQRELAPSKQPGEDYILPDERARQRACAQLAADASVDASEVEVTVLSGALKLSGSVPNAATKERAAQLCTGIPGVTSIENALLVK
jgi:osmotically-inducible protein OsmY